MFFSKRLELVGLAAWLMVGACDPRVFDDLGSKAPVQVAEAPSGLDHFGPGLVSMDGRGQDADRPQVAVAAGMGTEALVVAKGLSDGRMELRSGGESPEAGTAGAVRALVQTGRLSGPEGDGPGVLVGVPEFGVVYAAVLGRTGEPMGLADRVLTAGDCNLSDMDEFGGGLGAADLDGDGHDEWIVRSRYSLCVFGAADLTAAPLSCPLLTNCQDCDDFHSWDGPLATGRLLNLPAGRSTLVVGLPSKTRGSVHFLAMSGSGSILDQSCDDVDIQTFDLQAPAGMASFGSALVVADLDGDGWDELFVGAPGEQKVFVYSVPAGGSTDWANATPVLEVTPENTAEARAFGAAMTLADLDGDGRLELAVGDPDAKVGGEDLAGRVHLFSLDLAGMTATRLAVLQEREPDRAHHLGKALGRIVPSGETWRRSGGLAHELLVTADEALYLFLETGTEGDVWNR